MKLKHIPLALTALTSFAGMTISSHAQQAPAQQAPAAPAKTLTPGVAAPALKGITWVQGDAVKTLDEKGKLYIVECWATWCGPCVAIIPHMNDLHKKYAEKGLVIIGMNVFEEGIEKSQKFVKDQGDKMAYRVAYSGGKAGDFSTSWLEASQTNGIPSAFVVKDGKVLFHGHPSGLTEEKIEAMMAADLDIAAFIKKEAEEAAKSDAFMKEIQGLYQKQDWKGLKEFVSASEFAKGKVMAASILSQANTQLGDWDGQATLIQDIAAGNYGKEAKATELVGMSLAMAEENEKVIAIAKTLAPKYSTEGKPNDGDFFARIAYSRVLFLSGDKEASVKELEATLKATDEIKGKRGADRFIAKIEETLKAAKAGKFPAFK